MKKHDRVGTTLRTNIEEISAIGDELSDEHLRLVVGATRKLCTWVQSSSYTEPGKVDPSRDCEDDS